MTKKNGKNVTHYKYGINSKQEKSVPIIPEHIILSKIKLINVMKWD